MKYRIRGRRPFDEKSESPEMPLRSLAKKVLRICQRDVVMVLTSQMSARVNVGVAAKIS